ncbi:hypothetical protein EZV73_17055 [Acidaminobacter sp. JC074]|uniref:hypothetical protein n=1 Tax=Acidaminobacter sp. JC074 TaxID=2530199 RepID=UPI001F0E5333|nr:hypothetical protein [Acidaminobacter sp. JC074]MCH4889309.1 hypothetical protein [Acidaminobacter sp. JC074]
MELLKVNGNEYIKHEDTENYMLPLFQTFDMSYFLDVYKKIKEPYKKAIEEFWLTEEAEILKQYNLEQDFFSYT